MISIEARRERQREWYHENKHRLRAKRLEYMKEYQKRPEVKERINEYHRKWSKTDEQKQKTNERQNKYKKLDYVKEKRRKYETSDEYRIKHRAREYAKLYLRDRLKQECNICKSKDKLEIHHLTYSNHKSLDSIIITCKPCHIKQHGVDNVS